MQGAGSRDGNCGLAERKKWGHPPGFLVRFGHRKRINPGNQGDVPIFCRAGWRLCARRACRPVAPAGRPLRRSGPSQGEENADRCPGGSSLPVGSSRRGRGKCSDMDSRLQARAALRCPRRIQLLCNSRGTSALMSPSGMVETPRLRAKDRAVKSTRSTSQGRSRIATSIGLNLARKCRGDRQGRPSGRPAGSRSSGCSGDLTVAPTIIGVGCAGF